MPEYEEPYKEKYEYGDKEKIKNVRCRWSDSDSEEEAPKAAWQAWHDLKQYCLAIGAFIQEMRLKGEERVCAQSGRGYLEQIGLIVGFGLSWLDKNQFAEKDTPEKVLEDTDSAVNRLLDELARARARGGGRQRPQEGHAAACEEAGKVASPSRRWAQVLLGFSPFFRREIGRASVGKEC